MNELNYINIWKFSDSKSNYTTESCLLSTEEEAIKSYYEYENNGFIIYQYTIVFNNDGTWNKLNLIDRIEEIKEEELRQELEFEEEERKYGSYEEQVKSYYNSTRI